MSKKPANVSISKENQGEEAGRTTIIMLVHEAAKQTAAEVWNRHPSPCDDIVAICNAEENADGWPWPCVAYSESVNMRQEHRTSGLPGLRKMHFAVDLAADIEGTTAITEYDAVLLHGWSRPAADWKLLVSTQYQVSQKIGMRGIGRTWGLAPWVTTQGGWKKISATMNQWRTEQGAYLADEEGFTDRFITLAAQVSGLVVFSAGYGIVDVDDSDQENIRQAIENAGTLFHGFKSTDAMRLLPFP